MPRPRRVALVVGVAALLLVAAGVVAYLVFFRSDAPPPVSTESAIAACQKTEPEVESMDDVSGMWSVVANPEPQPVEDGSFVGYRVNEELSGIGSNTAAGRTRAVTGDFAIDGATVTEVSVTAELAGLESDDGRRDEVVRERALETDQFPEATFELAEPIALDAVPEDGVSVTATAKGDLTLHGVTKPVELELEAQRLGPVIAVIGSTDLLLTDYGITPPKVGPVLSIEDHGKFEVQLCFEKGTAS